MLLHPAAQLGIDLAINVVRDLAPDVDTTDFYSSQGYQGLTFFQDPSPTFHAPSKPGASASRICRRARNNRVFTEASVRPSACAVSAMLTFCMSRITKTSRYFSSSEARAFCNACRSSLRCNVSDGISRQSAKSRGK